MHAVLVKDQPLRHFSLSWLLSLALGAIVCKTLVVPLLINFFPFQSLQGTFLFTQSEPGPSHALCEEPPLISQELSRTGAQQSLQTSVFTRASSSFRTARQKIRQLWVAPSPISLLLFAFLPRKSTPPAAEDEPPSSSHHNCATGAQIFT